MRTRKICITFSFILLGTLAQEVREDNGGEAESLEPVEPQPPNGHIVGGMRTSIRNHPHQVSMILNGTNFCGGFIISASFVMTAAHCVQGLTASHIRLRVGSTFRDRGGRIVPAATVTWHERYGQPNFDNDIAVIGLAEPLVFSPSVRAIPIPRRNRPVPAGRLTVTGWGLTVQGGRRIPRGLRMARVPVVWQWLCQLAYGNVITSNMFCGGHFLIGGISSCQGDSGGAAVINGVAYGIVSFARGCALPLSPTVFSNIAALRGWVRQNAGI